jgi:CopA family copper-resistance protein
MKFPQDRAMSDGDATPTGDPVSRRDFLGRTSAALFAAGVAQLSPPYARRLARSIGASPSATIPGGTAGTIDLAIRDTLITVGDRRASATTINGTVPGPLLRFTEGTDAIIRVTNGLREDTSVHWHGVIVPNPMDGVPGVTFPGIRAGESFTYRLPIRQYGTYWYHSHSGLQEQSGVYGPLIIDPIEPEPFLYEREFVVVLSDWSFENPYTVLDKVKKKADYYQFQKRTVGDFFRDVDEHGWRAAIADRREWAKMRMSPVDLSDLTGATYTYLMNGQPPGANWTALFKPGERVRLRFINSGAGSTFDVRIPGLEMTVVQVSGQHVQPVTTDEFRIGIAETYDVIVQPSADRAYTIFAESSDRSGHARGTLAVKAGMTAAVPMRRPRPLLTMADMGMSMNMAGMDMGSSVPPSATPVGAPMAGMGVPAVDKAMAAGAAARAPGSLPVPTEHGPSTHGRGNASTPMITRSRLDEPGSGLGADGWRVLVYTDIRALVPRPDALQPPTREIEFHLTGNMERFMWSIDGKKFSEAPAPIQLTRGERIRLTIVNDTMMPHPMHLHGMWMELENGTGADIPRVHTINVKPAERVSALVTPRDPGAWAFHCHVLLHMEMGMFRVIQVNEPGAVARVES